MFKFTFAIALLVLAPMCFADDAAELKALLDRVTVLQGQFAQELSDAEGQTIQKSSGSFSLKRPGYFRWQSDEPYPQLVVGTPEKVWVYDPDLEQVTVRKNTDQHSPAALISGDLAALKNSYKVEKGKAKKNTRRFVLQPISDQESYGQVELTFANDSLVALSFLDKLDQKTRITFTETTENGKVDDALFEFDVPESADLIIDE